MSLAQWKNLYNSLQQEREQYIYVRCSKNLPNATIEACRHDIPRFGKVYIPEYISYDYVDHHYLMFRAMSIRTGRIVCILLPRGAGKTTILFVIALHAICYGTERYIVQIEHDGDLAQSAIQKFVKVFTENAQILQDFPEVRPASPWKPSEGELNFSNGVLVRYIGLNQLKSRGSTHHESRITLAIANDLIDLKNAKSPTETKFIYDLITKDLAKAGPLPGQGMLRRCYLGTSISQTDAAWRLSESPMTKMIKIPAIQGDLEIVKQLMIIISEDARNISDYCDQFEAEKIAQVEAGDLDPEDAEITDVERWVYIRENREKYEPFFDIPEPGEEDNFVDVSDKPLKSYWPEVYSMAYFAFDAGENTQAFMQERQHVTGDTQFQKFYEHWFVPYDGTPEGNYLYGMGIDTSGEPKEGSDPMAIVAGAYNTDTEDFYVLEVWCAQATPEELVETAHNIYFRHFRSQGREANVYLEAIVSATGLGRSFFRQTAENQINQGSDKELWETLPIYEINPQLKKEVRLMAMRPIAEQRRIHVNKGHSQQNLLIRQWCNWTGESTHKALPIEYKIDGPDAMTMLFQNISKRRQKSAAGEPRYRHTPPQHRAVERYRPIDRQI